MICVPLPASSGDTVRAQPITVVPLPAFARTIASPIPRLAPVTSAVFPVG